VIWLRLRYGMSFQDANELYNKYTNNWGDAVSEYRFDGVKDGAVVASVTKAAVTHIHLQAEVSSNTLFEGDTYDAALVRITMRDQNGNLLPFYQEAATLKTEGPIRLIGPAQAMLRGGMGGTFVRTVGAGGRAVLTLSVPDAEPVRLEFNVEVKQNKPMEYGGI
jgi:beta-galactosidase